MTSQDIKGTNKNRKPWVMASLGLVVALVIIGALLMTVFLNPDSFREPIAAGLSRSTDLQITIDSIGWGFSHGLELRCGGVKVRSANGKRDLFSMEKLRLELELLPLLRKQIIVKNSTMVKPVIPIHANRFFKPVTPAAPPEKPQSDASNIPHKPPVRQTPLETLKTALKSADLTLSNVTVENGQIRLLQDDADESTLNIALKLKVLRPGQDQVNVALNSIDLGIGKLNLTGDMELNDVLGQGASLQANFKSNSFRESDLHSLPIPAATRHFLEQKKVAGNIKNVVLKLDAPLNTATDFESLKTHAKAQIATLVEEGSLTWGKTTVLFPRAEINGKWENNSLTHSSQGNALDGEFLVTGSTSPDSGDIVDITLTDIHLAKLEPREADGIVSGKLRMIRSSPPAEDLSWQGNLHARNLAWGAPEARQSAEDASISLKTLNKNETVFDVKLNRVSLGPILLKQALGVATVSDEKIQLTQGKIFPGHGQVDLNGTFYPLTQTYNVKFLGKKLAAEDLLPEYVQGPLEMEGNLDQGKQGLIQGLSGKVAIRLSDGSLRQLGMVNALLSLLNPQSLLTAQNEGLPYSHLGGDFIIRNGVVTTADLELDSPQLKLLLAGKADLRTGNLKGELKAMPLQLVDTVIKMIPLLGKVLAGKKSGVVETYFNIEGTLYDPKFTLLAGKSILGKPVRVLDELIKLPEPEITRPKEKTPEPSIMEKDVSSSNL